jgi:hypothetical protein
MYLVGLENLVFPILFIVRAMGPCPDKMDKKLTLVSEVYEVIT